MQDPDVSAMVSAEARMATAAFDKAFGSHCQSSSLKRGSGQGRPAEHLFKGCTTLDMCPA